MCSGDSEITLDYGEHKKRGGYKIKLKERASRLSLSLSLSLSLCVCVCVCVTLQPRWFLRRV